MAQFMEKHAWQQSAEPMDCMRWHVLTLSSAVFGTEFTSPSHDGLIFTLLRIQKVLLSMAELPLGSNCQ